MNREKNLTEHERILLGLPVSFGKLQFYPISMRHYEVFLKCQQALLVRLSSLSGRIAALPYLSAIFAFEQIAIAEVGRPTGLFRALIELLFLSLRIEIKTASNDLSDILIAHVEKGQMFLDALSIPAAGMTVTVTASEFSSVRRIIAEQNALTLPDESENADILRAFDEKKALGERYALSDNLADEIAAVAFLSGVREKDVYTWSVAEYSRRIRAIQRVKDYDACQTAELSGMVSFPKGNPAPSWRVDKVEQEKGCVALSALSLGNIAPKK